MRRLPESMAKWLDDYNRTMADLLAGGFKPTPENVRNGLADLTRSLVTHSPSVAWVHDTMVHAPNHSIPVRVYHPKPEARLAVLIYFHGGGHMAGSVAVYDPICRKLAKAATHIVVSVDYRLAPEHPYPAGVDDAFTVVGKVWEILDRHNLKYRRHLSMAGDSGGGAVCATVAHRAQHDPSPAIQRQVLIYPCLDYTLSTPSIGINGSGYLLETSKIQWYFDHYFQHREDRRKASPLHMEVTQRLPETMVITAEFCPLRDEGIAYVTKVQSQGIAARHLHFEDMIHAFMNMENLAQEACTALYDAVGTFLNA